jgi:predicted nucleotidyltransferase
MDEKFPHKKRIIAAILGATQGIKKLFLFGSRARQDNRNPHSDIDIGLIAEDRLNFSRLARIEEELDRLDTLYKVDVVNFTQREDVFTREAFKMGWIDNEDDWLSLLKARNMTSHVIWRENGYGNI